MKDFSKKPKICAECGKSFYGMTTGKYCVECKDLVITRESRKRSRNAFQRQKLQANTTIDKIQREARARRRIQLQDLL